MVQFPSFFRADLLQPTLAGFTSALLCLLLHSDNLCCAQAPSPPDHLVDVAIYGGTPSGIAAAITAGREGQTVLLIEPYSFVGGLMTNGLCHTDFRTFESITGFYREVTQRAVQHYTEKFGPDSPQVKDCWRGTQVEPSVMQSIFETLLQETKTIQVVTQHRLTEVDVAECCSDGSRVMNSATFQNENGKSLKVEASMFIDGTYEGDLMALAGIPYAIGREARSEFQEPLAPVQADNEVQGYNFRLIVTDQIQNRIMPTAPADYDRSRFTDVLPLFESGKLKSVWCAQKGGIYKNHRPALPNRKYDVNDVSRGLVRLSLPNDSNDWPDGSWEARQRILEEHVQHNIGLLYFLQNDPQVPEKVRAEARQFGWAADEFVHHRHVPEQLYVREARRMQGQHTYTQQDTRSAGNDVRSVFHPDAIAIGDYSHNCHGTAHEGPVYGGRHTGEFYEKAAPYQIPYGVIIPKKVTNVLVPVACSSSHVGFCALRLEPIWMSLGQAAGLAACHAINDQVPVQYVEVGPLQKRLHELQAATIYIGDLSPDDPMFQAAQWWGQKGAFHGLHENKGNYGQRGANIKSQYFRKFPFHDVQQNEVLDHTLRSRWIELAEEQNLPLDRLRSLKTPGEFIQTAFQLSTMSP